jgi:hypothetical protein
MVIEKCNQRLPPGPHYELVMQHEIMVISLSGPLPQN